MCDVKQLKLMGDVHRKRHGRSNVGRSILSPDIVPGDCLMQSFTCPRRDVDEDHRKQLLRCLFIKPFLTPYTSSVQQSGLREEILSCKPKTWRQQASSPPNLPHFSEAVVHEH